MAQTKRDKPRLTKHMRKSRHFAFIAGMPNVSEYI